MSAIQTLVDQYNAVEAQQTERRRAIIAALAVASSGHRTVLFAGGQQLSDHSLSDSHAAGPFLDRLHNPIVRIEGGE